MKTCINGIKIIIFSFLCMIVYYIVCGYNMYSSALENEPLDTKVMQIKQKQNYTKLSELPQIYLDAVVAVEDHRFFRHNGIDIISIVRAGLNDIKAMSFVEGGSTITQQLAKNIYFSQKKEITRKIAEVFMAFKIEKNYTKEEILELYINTAYYGNGYYSPKEACLGYFNKELINMTDDEAIMLVGIPNAPSVYNPKVNMQLAKQRQMQVIKKMIMYGYLSQYEADKILNPNDI